ncbi:MAG: transposase, partial [Cyanobacteria bacterium J06626_18]
PKGVKVVLLADRGFVHTDAMTMMTTQLGWHYRIRLKRDTWIWRAGKGWRQLKDFRLQRGEALCFHTVKLHKGEWFGPVHVAFGYNNINGEFWAIISDEPTSLHTFEEYGLRFDIEKSQPQCPHSHRYV